MLSGIIKDSESPALSPKIRPFNCVGGFSQDVYFYYSFYQCQKVILKKPMNHFKHYYRIFLLSNTSNQRMKRISWIMFLIYKKNKSLRTFAIVERGVNKIFFL
jgi:hypothetical protein